MSIKSLVQSKKYKDAVTAITDRLSRRPRDDIRQERAHIYLLMGHPHLARADFDFGLHKTHVESRTRASHIHSDGEYHAIGTTYWLEDRRELAIAFWRFTVEKHLAGQVDYSDSWGVGGFTSGLFLWFGAVSTRSKPDLELVRQLYTSRRERLKRLAPGTRPLSWPAALAEFYLNRIGDTELLACAAKCGDDCAANFAIAIRMREAGRYSAYRKFIQAASQSTDNPYDRWHEYEWFLAKHELRRLTPTRR